MSNKPQPSIHSSEFFVGRQPIFNRLLRVVGYELLYRSYQAPEHAAFVDGDQATLTVMLNTFSQAGLDNIVGDDKAFVNATRNFLLGNYPIPFTPERIVLEVLEDIEVDKPLIDALKNLKRLGYQIALDDVSSTKRAYDLLTLAGMVKINIPSVAPNNLPYLVASLKRYNLKLLAEKVETQQDYQRCARLGFDYFQGYFLCRPTLVKGRQIDTSRLVLMRSLAKLQDPKMSFQDLEEIIALDATLGYRLLKLVNSSYYGLITPVRSIRQGISLIGLNQLRGWMSLLLMASVVNKPHELSTIAFIRARMAEKLAYALRLPNADEYFLVGLLSVLDAILDMPMQKIIENLPLEPDITIALLKYQGAPGDILRTILAYEQGDWDSVLQIGLDPQQIKAIYLDTVSWATKLSKEVTNL